MLAFFLKYNFPEEAAAFSKLYLVLAGSLVIFGIPCHVNFYKAYFEDLKNSLFVLHT